MIQLLEERVTMGMGKPSDTFLKTLKQFVYDYGPSVLLATAAAIFASLSEPSFTMAATVECGVNQPTGQ